jgi:hypothetical protein
MHKKKRTSFPGQGKMLTWKQFYNKNKSWIHTIPLTKAQAFGTKATPRYEIPYEKLEDLKKLGRIIICTYKDTPIRVKVQPKPTKD